MDWELEGDSPQTVEYMKKRFILRHLAKDLDYLEKTAKALKDWDLFTDCEDLALVWCAIKDYHDTYKALPPATTLRLNLEIMYDEGGLSFDKQYLKDLLVEIASEGLDTAHAKTVFEELRQEHLRQKLANKVQSSDDLKGDLGKISAEISENLFQTLEHKNPFNEDPDEYLVEAERVPMGIDFIDHSLGGGTLGGEMYGFLMPAKGGKTTLAWQACDACVMRERHVVLFSFEQELKGDLTRRSYILSSKASRDDWKVNSIAQLDPQVKARFFAAKPLWGKYLHVYDQYVNPGTQLCSVRDLFLPIEKMQQEGNTPFLVIIDWWGLMRRKLETSNQAKTDYDRRMQAKEWLQAVKGFSSIYGVRTLLFHQLTSAKAGQKQIANAHDAQEDKSFVDYLDFCFVSKRKDSEGNVLFRLDAARAAANSEVTVFLDGNHCKFVSKSVDFDASLMEEMDETEKENEDPTSTFTP